MTYDFQIHEHGQQENETKTKLEVTKKHKTHVLTTHSQYPITWWVFLNQISVDIIVIAF